MPSVNFAALPSRTCAWKDTPIQLHGGVLAEKINNAGDVSPSFRNVGQKPGLHIWKVTKYNAVHWPREMYGDFYEEDVYLLLMTAPWSESLAVGRATNQIFLWSGKGADPEDYATGCYKAYQLDELCSYEATVNREIQGKETTEFKQLFKYITVWLGSSDNSYFSVKGIGGQYGARLLRWYRPDIRNPREIRIKEIEPLKENVDSEFLMILDLGHQIYLWLGSEANKADISQAIQHLEGINASRGGEVKIMIENEGIPPDHFFYFYLREGNGRNLVDSDDETSQKVADRISGGSFTPILFSINVKKGRAECRMVKQGVMDSSDFASQQICMYDTGEKCYICATTETPQELVRACLQFAHEYLRNTEHQLLPITVLKKGHLPEDVQ